jgi:DNA mismatch repair ATPase MutS
MKAYLLYRDQDFNLQRESPWNEEALTQDLGLNMLFDAMGHSDKFLLEVVRKVLLSSSTDTETILYRQNILKDCLKNPSVVRELYDIVMEAIEEKRKSFWAFFSSRFPSSMLHGGIESLQIFVVRLKKLRSIADKHGSDFKSEGFARFFTMLHDELSDEYFDTIQYHLTRLKFDEGVLVSAELGEGNKGTNYVLRKPWNPKVSWMTRSLVRMKSVVLRQPQPYTFELNPRDESGAKALGELRDRGINLVANALAQSTDHILGFFNMLRIELAFYIGCLNLYEQLAKKGEQICFPVPFASNERRHSFVGLYDVCLALSIEQRIVGNDVNADGKSLIMITGANQGGKSTFLRSIGLAQLMMQCGMFVAAGSFIANICDGIFTHYRREEDAAMGSGKFDEELSRMSDIADHVTPNSLLLFNESFAATNEREGSEIARQIVSALLEKGNKVFFVTHLYELARGFYEKKTENAIFLRAERETDGTRTFKLIEGEPLETSYGEDLYNKIFVTLNHR